MGELLRRGTLTLERGQEIWKQNPLHSMGWCVPGIRWFGSLPGNDESEHQAHETFRSKDIWSELARICLAHGPRRLDSTYLRKEVKSIKSILQKSAVSRTWNAINHKHFAWIKVARGAVSIIWDLIFWMTIGNVECTWDASVDHNIHRNKITQVILNYMRGTKYTFATDHQEASDCVVVVHPARKWFPPGGTDNRWPNNRSRKWPPPTCGRFCRTIVIVESIANLLRNQMLSQWFGKVIRTGTATIESLANFFKRFFIHPAEIRNKNQDEFRPGNKRNFINENFFPHCSIKQMNYLLR